jgi:hypothetical protein
MMVRSDTASLAIAAAPEAAAGILTGHFASSTPEVRSHPRFDTARVSAPGGIRTRAARLKRPPL